MARRSVLITREERSNPSFEARLAAAGALVHGVSLTRTAEPSDPEPLYAAVRTLAAYDWVLVTSGRAVKSIAKVMREESIELPRTAPAPLWGCVGPGTATALKTELGLEPDLIPPTFDAASLAQALLAHEAARGAERPLRILFPAARDARAALPALLRAAGHAVEQVVAYEIEPDPPPIAALAPPHGEHWDVVVFTSGLAVQILLATVASERGTEGARDWLRASRTAVLGLSAAEALREVGIEPSVQAARPTLEDLADAVLTVAIPERSK